MDAWIARFRYVTDLLRKHWGGPAESSTEGAEPRWRRWRLLHQLLPHYGRGSVCDRRLRQTEHCLKWQFFQLLTPLHAEVMWCHDVLWNLVASWGLVLRHAPKRYRRESQLPHPCQAIQCLGTLVRSLVRLFWWILFERVQSCPTCLHAKVKVPVLASFKCLGSRTGCVHLTRYGTGPCYYCRTAMHVQETAQTRAEAVTLAEVFEIPPDAMLKWGSQIFSDKSHQISIASPCCILSPKGAPFVGWGVWKACQQIATCSWRVWKRST